MYPIMAEVFKTGKDYRSEEDILKTTRIEVGRGEKGGVMIGGNQDRNHEIEVK